MPPASRIGPLSAEERQALVRSSSLYGHYEKSVDRESAHELLKARAEQTLPPAKPAEGEAGGGLLDSLGKILAGSRGPRGGRREGLGEALAKSVVRTVGSQIGREIIRGILGGVSGSRRR